MDSLTFPEDFKIKTVSEFCAETKSGSTPSRTNNEYWENGTISWVKSGEVHNNITLQTEEYITPPENNSRRCGWRQSYRTDCLQKTGEARPQNALRRQITWHTGLHTLL